MIRLVDGKRSISEMISDSQFTNELGGKIDAKVFARNFFRSLWRTDFTAFELPRKPISSKRKRHIGQV
jgi:hypothetical protein